ncbi:hypothetical protein ACWCW7_34395 [Nocardia tengchongensis]
MSGNALGLLVAVAPLVVIALALIAWACSDSRGRRAAAAIFGATTASTLPVVLGLYLMGRNDWLIVLATIAGLDLVIAITASVMAAFDKSSQDLTKPCNSLQNP